MGFLGGIEGERAGMEIDGDGERAGKDGWWVVDLVLTLTSCRVKRNDSLGLFTYS